MTIKLNVPVAPDLDVLSKYLEEVNKRAWYTNFGPLHQCLTERLEEYLGVENLLLTANGTLALQVAYKTLGVKRAITTPFSFVATASSLLWQGIETSFCDIDQFSYNLCPKKVLAELEDDAGGDTIVATHVYGNPCDIYGFENVSQQQKVKIIYDAAHAFGIKLGDRSVLSHGDASTLSFHATKLFHTIEGGAIVFKNKSDFEYAKSLINFGMDESGSVVDVGINAKLNEYQCAVGLTILNRVDEIIDHRAGLFDLYCSELDGIVEMPRWHSEATHNGAYMPIRLKDTSERARVEQFLKSRGVESKRYFHPALDVALLKEDGFRETHHGQSVAESILCLPLHYSLTSDEILRVVALIRGSVA